jgi:hypothetical protein
LVDKINGPGTKSTREIREGGERGVDRPWFLEGLEVAITFVGGGCAWAAMGGEEVEQWRRW